MAGAMPPARYDSSSVGMAPGPFPPPPIPGGGVRVGCWRADGLTHMGRPTGVSGSVVGGAVSHRLLGGLDPPPPSPLSHGDGLGLTLRRAPVPLLRNTGDVRPVRAL